MASTYSLAVIPGDGIGGEVVAEALKARFGAVEPANADRAEKVEPAAKVVASPSAKTAG